MLSVSTKTDRRQAALTHSCLTSTVTLALGDKGPRSAPERFSLCSPVTQRTCYKTMIPVLDVTSCRVDCLVTDRQVRPFVKTVVAGIHGLRKARASVSGRHRR